MKRILALLLAFALAALIIFGVQPASATPETPAAPVELTDTAHDVCAVLKAQFDPLNNAYFVFEAEYHTYIFQDLGNLEFAIVQCLFLPLRSPNYGNLCQQAAWEIFPVIGPIQVSPIVPMGNPRHMYCP